MIFTNNGAILTSAEDALTEAQDIFIAVFGANVNIDPASPNGLFIQQIANSIMERDSNIAYLLNSLNPLIAVGVALDAICSNLDVKRIPPGKSFATCQVTGLSGTVIPANTQIQSTNQDVFVAKNSITIGVDGTGSGIFEAQIPGAIPVPEDSLTTILQGVNGWDTVNNAAAGTVGNTLENDAELRERFLQSQASASTASFLAIQAAIGALQDVQAFFLYENITTATVVISGVSIVSKSIYLCIVGGEDEDIAQALFNSKSAGCLMNGSITYNLPIPDTDPVQYFVAKFDRAIAVDFTINVTLVTGGIYSPTVDQDIVDAINASWQYNKLGAPIYATNFVKILENAGIAPIVSITLTSGSFVNQAVLVLPITDYIVTPLTTDNINVIV